jgi:hypothetical protein
MHFCGNPLHDGLLWAAMAIGGGYVAAAWYWVRAWWGRRFRR